jgi:hypothetical protein
VPQDHLSPGPLDRSSVGQSQKLPLATGECVRFLVLSSAETHLRNSPPNPNRTYVAARECSIYESAIILVNAACWSEALPA